MTSAHDPNSPAGACSCPYCEASTEEPFPFCSICGKEVARCPECRCVVKTEDDICPRCGAVLSREDTER